MLIQYRFFALVSLLFIVACGNAGKHSKISGFYITDDKNIFYQLLHRGLYATGCELQLNTDSTFKYLTCGNVMTGNWNGNGDSLILNVISNRYRNDSLNKTWPAMGLGVCRFYIDGEVLSQISKVWHKGKYVKRYNFLKRIN